MDSRLRGNDKFRPLVLAGILLLLTAACAAPANTVDAPDVAEAQIERGSCGVASVEAAGETLTDEAAVEAVLRAEGARVVAQEINPLMGLWAEESQVVDAAGTPDDESDDQRWIGVDAIRNRYVRIVFPGAPSLAQPADLDVSFMEEEGTPRAVVTATTQIGDEVSPAGDRWTLVQQDGCWLIESLTYNLETP